MDKDIGILEFTVRGLEGYPQRIGGVRSELEHLIKLAEDKSLDNSFSIKDESTRKRLVAAVKEYI